MVSRSHAGTDATHIKGISMTLKFTAAVAAAFVGMAAPAAAEHTAYVTGFAGADSPDSEALDGSNAAGQVRDIDVSLEDGAVSGLAIGVASTDYSFGRFRAEVEASFRQSDVGGVRLNGVDRVVLEGSEVSVAAGMINLVYDTPVYFERLRFSAGAGFGIASIDHEIRYLVVTPAAIGTFPGNLQIAIPATETTYAYQIIGGVEVALSPHWSLVGDIRYFDLGEIQAQRFILNTIIDGVPTTNGTLDSILDAEYSTTSVTAGLRFTF